jgi:hypothetical protein
MEPKTPKGIYKTHLEQTQPFSGTLNSKGSRLNLAASSVNGFVNSSFSMDKMQIFVKTLIGKHKSICNLLTFHF